MHPRNTRIFLLKNRPARAVALRGAPAVHISRAQKERLAEMRRTVLAYWKRAGRDNLPWRKTRDPYRVLVSEMMLQQTQVHRVVPYYERFIERFPTVASLAEAPLADVLALWSGLGYNRRAKYLHAAASQFSVLCSPDRKTMAYEDLRRLPGVGDYTAKAVRVFAFSEPEALIETNVRAVFIRYFFPKARKVSDERLMPLIEEAVADLPRGTSVRAWYSALMDYGTCLKATQANPSRKSTHYVRQSKFEGSLRQVRGAIVRALIRNEGLISVRNKFPKRFDEAYRALRREGFIQT